MSHWYRLLLVSASAALAVAVVAAPTASATAHESLGSSSPSEDEQLETAPQQIELVFNADILTIGADVLVVDESGKDWVSGDPTITGTTLTAPLAPDMPDAGYQVRWRVVSGDGHPISSVIPFTVGDGEPYVSATPSPEVSFQADADADAEVEATADRDQAPELWQLALLGIGGAAGAVLLFVLFSFLNRRRRARSDDETRRPIEPSDNFERHDS